MEGLRMEGLREKIRKLVIKYQFEKKLCEMRKKGISEFERILLFENIKTEWYMEEELKHLEEFDPTLLPEKERKLYNILLQGKEIVNVYKNILTELVYIAEREGIDKVEKNFPKCFNFAIREVLPKPDNYKEFRKRVWEYLKDINKELSSDLYFGNFYETMEFYEQQFFDQIEKEVQEIYG